MRAEHGVFRSGWKPPARALAPWRAGVDLIFPLRGLDGASSLAGGLPAETSSRIHILDGLVCYGCGAPFEYDQGEGARCMARPRPLKAAEAARVDVAVVSRVKEMAGLTI